MNHTVRIATGIDLVIKDIQSEIYETLTSLWGDAIDGYGRVYKNRKGGKYIPEAYMGNGDYSDTFFNDVRNANFFFLVDEKADTDDGVVYTSEVKIVFMLDLVKCIVDRYDRMDALAHSQIMDMLVRISRRGKFTVTGYETGIDNIFSGFDTKGIKYDDIQPLHCFAAIIDMNHYLTECKLN